jgi:hypothetical protein
VGGFTAPAVAELEGELPVGRSGRILVVKGRHAETAYPDRPWQRACEGERQASRDLPRTVPTL